MTKEELKKQGLERIIAIPICINTIDETSDKLKTIKGVTKLAWIERYLAFNILVESNRNDYLHDIMATRLFTSARYD